jgi:uncharacterized secreted protein with C-terminal beta-propeller domain
MPETNALSGASGTYSQTNIQVAGVDEADIVKNDGEYIYVVTGNKISILKAYPPQNATLMSTIIFDEAYPAGIFVSGDRLVVLGSNYTETALGVTDSRTVYPYGYYGINTKTFAKVYDVSNRTAPKALTTFSITGYYFNSRMIGKYVYFVASQPSYVIYDTVILPKMYVNNVVREVQASEIHYSNSSDEYYAFTSFVALNFEDTTEEPTHMTIMMGGTSNMYVSLSNIYVTYPDISGETTIYRIRIRDNNLTSEARGKVPGHELNQFSMDEYGEYFRMATTNWMGSSQRNALYVLNMNLSIVGKLENIANGENLHSARFMGDRCYLVTFIKTDPLFVIDLSQPTDPKILGELKIPGYSDYLHPYDENHIIGVGKEAVGAEEGNFAWYQGIKVSLFDVSNVSNPVQMANYTIGDRGSDSPILYDHKAFLFDKSMDLLVIPVSVAKVDPSQYPDGVPPNAYGTVVWQGAYVFNITLAQGFALKGTVTHVDDGAQVQNTTCWVKRSLYIGNVLYTVSDIRVKMNSLEDLAFIKEIDLG